MAPKSIIVPAVALGRVTFAAALAGIVGLALTIVIAASLLLGPAAGRNALQPGYLDYGQRHPAAAPATTVKGDSRLDDYGLRCVATGWCPEPWNDSHR